jgi:hypothetical protein
MLSVKERGILTAFVVLFTLGNRYSSVFSLMAVALLYGYILISSREQALYLVFFLIPNIRIADNLGFTGFINLAFLLAGYKWIVNSLEKFHKYGWLLVLTAALFSMLHMTGMHDLAAIVNLVMDIFIMLSVLSDEKRELETDKLIRCLSLGILASMAVYILANSSSLSGVFSSNSRMAGYGDDPNYYSIYILISISFLFLKMKEKGNQWLDTLLLLALVFIGLLTSSKMFLLCCAMIFVCFFVTTLLEGNRNGVKAILMLCMLGGLAVLLKKDSVFYLLGKVIKRFTVISTRKTTGLYALTTGRSRIFANYLHLFTSDLTTFFWGRGLSYNSYLAPLFGDTRVAHNTYLDFLLSWGMIGCILFAVIFHRFLNSVCTFPKKGFVYMPLLVFLAVMLVLSSLTADMFWYMMLLVLLPFCNNCHVRQDIGEKKYETARD